MEDHSWDIGLAVTTVWDQDGYLGIQTDVEGSEAGGGAPSVSSITGAGDAV